MLPPVPAPVKVAPVPVPKPTPAPVVTAKPATTAAKTAAAKAAAAKKAAEAKTDDDDDDDKPDAKSTASTSAAAAKKAEARKAAAEKDATPDPEPPQTLMELFARLGQTKPPAPAAPPRLDNAATRAGPTSIKPAPAWGQTKVVREKSEPAATKSDGGAAASGKSAGSGNAGSGVAAKGATAAGGAAAVLTVPVSVGHPVGREVLAPRLSAKGIATAVALLKFKVGSSTATLASPDLSLVRLVPPDGMSAVEAQRKLREAMPLEEFGRNLIYRPYRRALGSEDDAGTSTAPPADGSDCPANRCYASKLMDWQQSRLGGCAQRVKVGVIDTSHDGAHPAFADRRISVGKVARSNTPMSPNWHGTGVLAILSGNPGSTTPGLIPDAEFFVADVFFGDSRGQPMSDSYSLLNALELMEKFGVDVVNLSLAGPRDALVEKEIARLVAKGIVFVAAAGNDGPTAGRTYPAAYKGVIAVTAVNRDLYGYRHANQGDYIDVAAPGVGIWTALPGRKEGYLTGTSFAAPYVTAVVAVMKDHVKGWSKERILDQLQYKDLGSPGRDMVFGRGLVQAPKSCVPDKGQFETAVMANDDTRAKVMRVNGPGSPAR